MIILDIVTIRGAIQLPDLIRRTRRHQTMQHPLIRPHRDRTRRRRLHQAHRQTPVPSPHPLRPPYRAQRRQDPRVLRYIAMDV